MRFPGFKGQWEIKKLGEIGDFKNGINKSSEDFGFGVPFVNLMDVFGKPTISSTDKFGLVNATTKETELYDLKRGDVLFIRSSVKKSGVGETSVIMKDLSQTVYSGFLIRFRDIKSPLELNFKKYCFYTKGFRNRLVSLSSTSANTNINQESLNSLAVFLPSLSEQSQIASFLSLIDDRINTQSKIIRESDVLKNVISQRIFSQELRFQDNNGCDFPAWETKKLKEVCDINPKTKSVPNSFYYIDLESVVNGRLLKEDRILKSEAPSRAQRVLAKNDILFQMVRPYQKNNLFFDKEGEYVASTGYAQIRTKQSSRFIYQYLHNRRFVDKVIERCTGTSYPAISSTDLGNIEIDCPSISEQIKIGDFLASIDTKIDLENQLLKKIKDQKKHLLANLFI